MARRGLGSAAPRTVILLALFCFSISVANPYESNGLLVAQEEEESPCDSPEFRDLEQKMQRREPLTLEEHARFLELKKLCQETSRSQPGEEPSGETAEIPAAAVEDPEKGLTSVQAVVLVLGVGLLVIAVAAIIDIATSDWTVHGWGN